MLKWSNYMKNHPANADYNKHLASLQMLIPESENDVNSFRQLADNKFIICITKGLDNEIQATFCHSMIKKSFTDKEPACLALTSFGTRAMPVKMAPNEIFIMTVEKKIPNFKDILKCENKDEVMALANTTISLNFAMNSDPLSMTTCIGQG